jgi:hypothetical protein
LVLVGGGLIASLWFGRAPGLVVVGLGLALLLLLASSLEPWFHRAGATYAHVGQSTLDPSLGQVHGRQVSAVGKHAYQPRSLDELASEYALGMGELTLDLSQLDFSGTTREVQVLVGTGKATVIVPPDTSVEAHGRAGLGDSRALDRRDGGFGSNVEASSEGSRAGTLRIDVGVGIGEGTVQRGL